MEGDILSWLRRFFGWKKNYFKAAKLE